MAKMIVEKSMGLNGKVRISGAKNSALPILAACLLTNEECIINSVPPLSDVYVMLEILHNLGVEIDFDEVKERVTIRAKKITCCETNYELTGKLRASFLVTGPLLARQGKVKVSMPGGCSIGSRPVDLHLKGFTSLGAKIKNDNGYIDIKGKSLSGSNIYLDFPSVGATENIIMASVLAKGITIIENAATEPEIIDLANFINKMGGHISGAGTDKVSIKGVEYLSGTKHTIIPDRIEAGSFMLAAAITRGNIALQNVIPDHIKPVIAKLEEANVTIEQSGKTLIVNAEDDLTPINIKTMPFPGFPTDMQAPFMTLMSLIKGTGIVTETIFENRFMHVGELLRMGANIKIDGRTAVVEGVKKLSGTQVRATDLRAGMALVLAGLCAEGKTEIGDIYHIERGYYNLEHKLNKLGANICTIEES